MLDALPTADQFLDAHPSPAAICMRSYLAPHPGHFARGCTDMQDAFVELFKAGGFVLEMRVFKIQDGQTIPWL